MATEKERMLTAENVEKIFKKCTAKVCKATDVVVVKGVRLLAEFDDRMLWRHYRTIKAMLDELPDEFHCEKGGGWTFLNMCVDKEGCQWADAHETVDKLVCLGRATGTLDWSIPDKAMWAILPGGMPYITVDTKRDFREDGEARQKNML